jgi:hypothetical protein
VRVCKRARLDPLTPEFVWEHHAGREKRRGLSRSVPARTLIFAVTTALENRLLELHLEELLHPPERGVERSAPNYRNVRSDSSSSGAAPEPSSSSSGDDGDASSMSADGDDIPLREEAVLISDSARAERLARQAVGAFLIFHIYEHVDVLMEALDEARAVFRVTGSVESVLAVLLWVMGDEDNFDLFPQKLRDSPYVRRQAYLGYARVPYATRLHSVMDGNLVEENCTLYLMLQ